MGISEDGQRWASWLGDRVATRGAGGRVSHAELREQLAAAGHDVSGSTVSRWLGGQRPGTADVVAAVGEILGDRSGALLAAGYVDRTLEHYRREGEPEGKEIIVIGRNAAEFERIRHMTLDEILGLPDGPTIIIERSAPNNG